MTTTLEKGLKPG